MRPQTIFVICSLIGGLVFLSVAKSKLITYALPVFPAVAIICAVSWTLYREGRLTAAGTRWFVNLNRGVAVLGMIVPVCILAVCQAIAGNSWSIYAWLFAAVLAVVSCLTLIVIERNRLQGSVGLISVWVAGVVCLVMTWPLQIFAENYSERSLAQWANEQETLPEHLILVGEKPGSVIFYLRKELRQALTGSQLTSVRVDEMDSTVEPGSSVVFAVTNTALLRHDLSDQVVPGSFTQQVGQFRLYQFTSKTSSLTQLAWKSE